MDESKVLTEMTVDAHVVMETFANTFAVEHRVLLKRVDHVSRRRLAIGRTQFEPARLMFVVQQMRANRFDRLSTKRRAETN
jgi:hypothetical protein